MRNGGFRVVAALVLIGLVAALTGGAYAAGYSAGTTSGSTTLSPWVYGGAFGVSHVIGFFVSILVLLLIFRLVFFGAGGHRHHAWGYRRWGRGWDDTQAADWQRGPWQDPRQAMFDDWHRHAHEGNPATPGNNAQGGPASGGPNSGGQSSSSNTY